MQQSPRQPRFSLVAALALAATGAACDGVKPGRDASTAPDRVSEIGVRMDLTSAGTSPSISVLAFQATVIGAPAGDVRGVVDPLIAGTAGVGCQRRDVTAAPGALAAQGGRVDLDALPDFAIDLPGQVRLRPASRVFPEVASVVAGVVSESAPIDIAAIPERIAVIGVGAEDPADQVAAPPHSLGVDVPAGPLLLGEDGQPLPTNALIDPTHDLVLRLQTREAGKTVLELRPLYTTHAIACPVDPQSGRVVVPAAELMQLVQTGGHVPVSVEAVWRDTRPVVLLGRPARLSVEVHASAVVSLRR